MTGAILCRRLLEGEGIECDVAVGAANCYVPGERLIVLRPHCYHGNSRKQLTLAAHEAGHAAQEVSAGWAAPAVRWLLIGRLWLEWDASGRARRMMQAAGVAPNEDALEESWRGYLVPGLWQMGTMLAMLLLAWFWRVLGA